MIPCHGRWDDLSLIPSRGRLDNLSLIPSGARFDDQSLISMWCQIGQSVIDFPLVAYRRVSHRFPSRCKSNDLSLIPYHGRSDDLSLIPCRGGLDDLSLFLYGVRSDELSLISLWCQIGRSITDFPFVVDRIVCH